MSGLDAGGLDDAIFAVDVEMELLVRRRLLLIELRATFDTPVLPPAAAAAAVVPPKPKPAPKTVKTAAAPKPFRKFDDDDLIEVARIANAATGGQGKAVELAFGVSNAMAGYLMKRARAAGHLEPHAARPPAPPAADRPTPPLHVPVADPGAPMFSADDARAIIEGAA